MIKAIAFLEYHCLYDGTYLCDKSYVPSPTEDIAIEQIRENKFTSRVGVGEYDDELGFIIDYSFDIDWINMNYLIANFEDDCRDFCNDCRDFCSTRKVSDGSEWIFDEKFNDTLILFIPFMDLHDFPERNKVDLINRLAKENSPFKWFEERCK